MSSSLYETAFFFLGLLLEPCLDERPSSSSSSVYSPSLSLVSCISSSSSESERRFFGWPFFFWTSCFTSLPTFLPFLTLLMGSGSGSSAFGFGARADLRSGSIANCFTICFIDTGLASDVGVFFVSFKFSSASSEEDEEEEEDSSVRFGSFFVVFSASGEENVDQDNRWGWKAKGLGYLHQRCFWRPTGGMRFSGQ